jgi:hypothetical protein
MLPSWVSIKKRFPAMSAGHSSPPLLAHYLLCQLCRFHMRATEPGPHPFELKPLLLKSVASVSKHVLLSSLFLLESLRWGRRSHPRPGDLKSVLWTKAPRRERVQFWACGICSNSHFQMAGPPLSTHPIVKIFSVNHGMLAHKSMNMEEPRPPFSAGSCTSRIFWTIGYTRPPKPATLCPLLQVC